MNGKNAAIHARNGNFENVERIGKENVISFEKNVSCTQPERAVSVDLKCWQENQSGRASPVALWEMDEVTNSDWKPSELTSISCGSSHVLTSFGSTVLNFECCIIVGVCEFEYAFRVLRLKGISS